MTHRKEWLIVYDMIYGKHTNGFGWDAIRKVVIAASSSHKNAISFKTRILPYFKDLSIIFGKDRAIVKDAQTTNNIIEDLKGEENDNGGIENIEDGIGVEKDGFNGIENVGLLMDFEDNSYSRSPSTSRAKTRRVSGTGKTKTCMNTSGKAGFYRIIEILRCKMVEATKELTKILGTEHLYATLG
ncbi:hypothetical protein J1N35_039905 [Gossypium stocksii]|uniref:Myb/SANT-like domain-containing protein n=1 Tax=Gossypium stocksii TaxID=47602 RepID=A0A9D3UCN6_9ROSI|nr:hypothetical protein J1N35_039905 [Gossypium stocksii]